MAGLVAAVVAPVGAVVAQLIAALSMETSTEEESPAVIRVRCASAPYRADLFEEHEADYHSRGRVSRTVYYRHHLGHVVL